MQSITVGSSLIQTGQKLSASWLDGRIFPSRLVKETYPEANLWVSTQEVQFSLRSSQSGTLTSFPFVPLHYGNCIHSFVSQIKFIIEQGSCGLSDCPVLPVPFFAQSQDRYRISKPLAMPVQLPVPVEAAVNYTGKPRAFVPSWLTVIISVLIHIF